MAILNWVYVSKGFNEFDFIENNIVQEWNVAKCE